MYYKDREKDKELLICLNIEMFNKRRVAKMCIAAAILRLDFIETKYYW
jgi:hypothetical protein